MVAFGRINSGVIVYRINAKRLEILLVHQSGKRKRLWSIPKGGVDEFEEPEQAARRELREEANVDLQHLDFLGYIDYEKASKRLYCYMASFPEHCQVKCNEQEIDGARFFEIAEAKRLVERQQRTLIQTLQKIMAFRFRRGRERTGS